MDIKKQYIELNQAIIKNDVQKVKDLIKSGICIETVDINSNTPLDLAIECDKLEIFELLLNAGAIIRIPTIVNITDFSGNFCMEMLALIIENGIDVNITLEDKETLLMYAAEKGNLEVVKRLVDLGADINSISRQADFALLNAGCQGHQEIFDYLAPKTSLQLRELATERLPSRFVKRLKNLC